MPRMRREITIRARTGSENLCKAKSTYKHCLSFLSDFLTYWCPWGPMASLSCRLQKKRGKGYCKLRLSVECTFATLIARRHERVFFVPIATKPWDESIKGLVSGEASSISGHVSQHGGGKLRPARFWWPVQRDLDLWLWGTSKSLHKVAGQLESRNQITG